MFPSFINFVFLGTKNDFIKITNPKYRAKPKSKWKESNWESEQSLLKVPLKILHKPNPSSHMSIGMLQTASNYVIT